MELYFHVLHIHKRRECRFNFLYSKREKKNVYGSATVDLSVYGKPVIFDALSDGILNREDKEYIADTVLRNLICG